MERLVVNAAELREILWITRSKFYSLVSTGVLEKNIVDLQSRKEVATLCDGLLDEEGFGAIGHTKPKAMTAQVMRTLAQGGYCGLA